MKYANVLPPSLWICILHLKNGNYLIRMTADLRKTVERLQEDERLVYLRMFTNMQEAVGHRLFLESLPADSLRMNIRSLNPREKDIRKLLVQYYSY